MEFISKALFWVSNSLLIPDIILLLLFLMRALILLGSFYNQYMIKRKNDKRLLDKIKNLSLATVDDLRNSLPEEDNSTFIKYLRDLLNTTPSEAYSDYMLTNYEVEADKDTSLPKLLTKVGPMLGLIGTLVAMSPALVGLAEGNIAGMAYNMQIVFATTVVGLVISIIGIVTLQFKQRWYAKDVNNLDYVSRILVNNGE